MSTRDPYSRVEYRRLIAWPQRIRREWPLIEETLSTGPSRRLLDLGCGTGEHARFLAAQGLDVVGVDGSESMLEKARDQPLPPNLRFVAGDLTRLEEAVGGFFDGAICLSNTLPHLTTREDLYSFFRGLRLRLAEGAPVLVQLLNYERIFARGERHLPINFRPDGAGEIVFLQLMKAREPTGRDSGGVLFFPTTLKLDPDAEVPVSVITSRLVELRGWRRTELEEALAAAGFGDRELYGAFDGSPYQAEASRDLILVAR